MRRKNRSILLNKINPEMTCAEIGVWKGDFSNDILQKNPKKLFLIDPWVHQNYEGRWYAIQQAEMNEIYNNVCTRFSKFDNVEILRNYSTEVKLNQKLDWVYIDGNHSYEAVLEDLNFYFNYLKDGGFLCGDDYNWTDKHCPIGPRKAVNDFCENKNLNFDVFGEQFIIFG
jgi:hypothetical protein